MKMCGICTANFYEQAAGSLDKQGQIRYNNS